MNKFIIIFTILLLPSICLGATVYVRDNGGTIEYNSTACDDTGTWTDGTDLQTIVDGQVNGSGTCYVCGSTYDNSDGTFVGTDVDGDRTLSLGSSENLIGVGNPTIDGSDGNGSNDGNYVIAISNASDVEVSGLTVKQGNISTIYAQAGTADVTGVEISDNIITSTDDGNGVRGIFVVGKNGYTWSGTISENTISNISHAGILLYIENAAGDTSSGFINTTISDNSVSTISGSNGHGIAISEETGAAVLVCYGIDIDGNTIDAVTYNGIQTVQSQNTAQNYIRDNILTDCGTTEANPANGIDLNGSQYWKVYGNDVSTTVTSADDGNGIHLDTNGTVTSDNNEIYQNKFHLNTDGGGAGIHVGHGDDNDIYSNIIASNLCGIRLKNTDTTGNEFYNNTYYENSAYGFHSDNAGGNAPAFTMGNELIVGTDSGDVGIQIDAGCIGTDGATTVTYVGVYNAATAINDDDVAAWDDVGDDITGGLESDPKFVDAANDDFHLLVSSPCIDAGADLTATVLTDYDGQDADHANMDGDADGAVTDMDIGADQVQFLSVLSGATTLQYSLLDGGDGNYAGLAFSTGHTIDNVTIARCKSGALRVNGNQTVNNMAIADECFIVSGATLTVNNSAFQEAEVTATGDGTMTDTDCLFSQGDFGFSNKSSGNFHLKASSISVDAGADTGASTDIDGRVTPRVTHDIGGYEYYTKSKGRRSLLHMGVW